jgi:hypothetical protein
MNEKLKNTLDNCWTIYILLFFSFLQHLQKGFLVKSEKNHQEKRGFRTVFQNEFLEKRPFRAKYVRWKGKVC